MMVEDPKTDLLYGHLQDCAELLAQSPFVPNAYDRLRDWIRRGFVTPVGEYDGKPVYAMAEIYAVELRTRRHGKRQRLLTQTLLIAQDAH